MALGSQDFEKKGSTDFPEEVVRDQLARILASEGFSASPRLQQFLTYIVEETLSGRATRVKGKTIAADVYGRDLDDGGGAQNLVRVEAGRLRRLLDEYYDGAGCADPLRIHVDPGGYAPRFAPIARPDPPRAPPESQPPTMGVPVVVLGIVSVVAALTVGVLMLWPRDGPVAVSGLQEGPVREALRARSVPTLQAANLAEEARGMLFPVFDVQRQRFALDMFRHSIELAPTLHEGYAGAAQVLSVLAIVTPDDAAAGRHLAEANVMAEEALDLAPTDAWALSANGLVLAVSGDDDEALRQARLAVSLDPDNGYVMDVVGMTAILVDAPGLAAEVSDPERQRSGAGRFGARNIWGVSQLMLGQDEAVIAAFEGAAADGAPVSAPSLIFQAVAHDRLGQHANAKRLVDEITATWPDFPARFLVRRIFRDGSTVSQDILRTLDRYGYRSAKLDR